MKQSVNYDFPDHALPKSRYEHPDTETTVEIVGAVSGWDLVWRRGKETLRYHYRKLKEALKDFEDFKRYAKEEF